MKPSEDLGFSHKNWKDIEYKAMKIYDYILTTDCAQFKDICDRIEAVSPSVKDAIYITMLVKDMELGRMETP